MNLLGRFLLRATVTGVKTLTPRMRRILTHGRGRGRDRIVAALRALHLPAEPGVAYVAGEARDCQAVRRHLTSERGWPRTVVIVKPFWTPGKRGLD